MSEYYNTNTCIVVDDHIASHNVLRHYINLQGNLVLREAFLNPLDALDYLRSNRIDIIFLDVDMPEMNGMDFLCVIENDTVYNYPAVVLSTAHTQYALPALKKSRYTKGFLQKPYKYDDFIDTISKIKSFTVLEESILSKKVRVNQNDYIFIKVRANGRDQYERVNKDDIFYIQGGANYPAVYTESNRLLTRTTLHELEQNMIDIMVRVHRSYLVNTNHIKSVHSNVVVLGNAVNIPVGQSYRENLVRLLSEQDQSLS